MSYLDRLLDWWNEDDAELWDERSDSKAVEQVARQVLGPSCVIHTLGPAYLRVVNLRSIEDTNPSGDDYSRLKRDLAARGYRAEAAATRGRAISFGDIVVSLSKDECKRRRSKYDGPAP